MGAPSRSMPPQSPNLAITALRRLEHENLIGLIARDPEVVVIDFQTVGAAADPVDEDFTRAGLERRAGHRYLDNGVVHSIGDGQGRLLVVGRQTVRADGWRNPRRLEQSAADPCRRLATVGSDFPDDALVGVGHVDVSGGVERHPVEAGVLARDRHDTDEAPVLRSTLRTFPAP